MFRQSMENPTTQSCPDEYLARSQYALAQVLRQQQHGREAAALESSARTILNALLPSNIDVAEGSAEEMGLFDYLVSYKAGRTTLGRAAVKPLEIAETGIDQSISKFGEFDSKLHNPNTEDEA